MPKRLSEEDAKKYIGSTYGFLTIEEVFKKDNKGCWLAKSKCICGNYQITKLSFINHNRIKYCAKCSREYSKKKISQKNIEHFLGVLNPLPQWFIDDLVNETDKQEALKGTLQHYKKVLFSCKKGHPNYMQMVKNHIDFKTNSPKFGCPECKKNRIGEISKETLKNRRVDFPQWFMDILVLNEDKERARKKELNYNSKVMIRCPECHKETLKSLRSIINIRTGEKKVICVDCHKKEKRKEKRLSFPDWFIDELVNQTDKENALNRKLSATDIVEFKCNEGHIYKQRVCDHITLSTMTKKYSCQICGYSKVSNDMSTKFYNNRPEYPQWLIDDIVNEEDKQKAKERKLTLLDHIYFYCSSCGNPYIQCVGNRFDFSSNKKKATVCPACSNHTSSIELDFRNLIESLYHGEIQYNCRNVIPPYELDIFLPDKKIAIEINGSYWHRHLPIGNKNKEILYHQKKYQECNKLGIHLITIFDVDLLNKQEIIEKYIFNLFAESKKIFARKCELKKVNSTEANNLYNRYHILGKTTIQAVSYGLFYNDELLSCMSFQKGRYKENKNPVWTLTRFVTKSGYSIIGGASKLLRQFEKEYNPDILISYSDNDYFTGNVYSILGFTNIGLTKTPRYYWFLNGYEIKREQAQLKNLSKKYPDLYKESLSQSGNKEDYIMLKLGAFKVYRSGHTKWVKIYHS